jgi:hypothetical protein
MEAIDMREHDEINVKKVPMAKRLAFLPRKMSRHYLVFERYVYHFARKLIKEYDGGFWDFLELSNGGFYMRPSGYEKVTVEVLGNQLEAWVSADAAGVIVCMYALGYLAGETEDDRIIDLYHLLRSYINDHPEFELIRRAID